MFRQEVISQKGKETSLSTKYGAEISVVWSGSSRKREGGISVGYRGHGRLFGELSLELSLEVCVRIFITREDVSAGKQHEQRYQYKKTHWVLGDSPLQSSLKLLKSSFIFCISKIVSFYLSW